MSTFEKGLGFPKHVAINCNKHQIQKKSKSKSEITICKIYIIYMYLCVLINYRKSQRLFWLFLIYFTLLSTYVLWTYFACLSVCLFVSNKRQNDRTGLAQILWGTTHNHMGKVYGWSKFQKLAFNKLDFH